MELPYNDNKFDFPGPERGLVKLDFDNRRIAVRNRWFDVITLSELECKRNKGDGYFRVIYIQINPKTGEYYIGKANRPRLSEIKRYQGSGLLFASVFRKRSHEFVRYFIAICETAEETERVEASIVDKELLADEKCLNLVAGGGGTSNHPTIAETSEKKREYMKSHPEQFRPMLEGSRKAFQSGDTPALRARSKRIKEVMGAGKYRVMSRERMLNWRKEYPGEYAESRRKGHEKLKTPECQAKRRESLKVWIEKHPEEYEIWQEKMAKSRASQKCKEKRKASLKEWRDKHPEKAQAYAQKRAKAAAAKTSKAVSMIDLQSGKVLMVFQSQHAAAKWLVENGKAKNMNCVSSISSVCLRKPCTTGYGYRKKAFGYDWRFVEK